MGSEDKAIHDVSIQEAKDKFDYEVVKFRCINHLGLTEVTFNRMVTDLTLHGIHCWKNQFEAAEKIEALVVEAFLTGQQR